MAALFILCFSALSYLGCASKIKNPQCQSKALPQEWQRYDFLVL